MSDPLDNEKRLYALFWNLLRDRELMRVFEKFGPAAFRRSSVLEGFETFIKAQNFKGKTCVEIGTLKGLTACVLARYFERVMTVDIIDDPQKLEIADMLGARNIEFVNVRNNAEKAEVIEAINFDAAYVDGDHAHDTESDFALVKRCGRVLAHNWWDCQDITLVGDLRQTLEKAGGTIKTQGKFALWTA